MADILKALLIFSVLAGHAFTTNVPFGKYIVTLKPHTSEIRAREHMQWARAIHRRSLSANTATGVEKVWELSSLGFHAYTGSFDSASISEIQSHEDVVAVEPDISWTVDNHFTLHQPRDSPAPLSPSHHMARSQPQTRAEIVYGTMSPAPWALGSISHRTPHHRDLYIFDMRLGTGTFAYVLDTGIDIDHPDFGGRAYLGGQTNKTRDLLDIHGTMVASIIAGWPFGVAQNAALIDVKIDGGGVDENGRTKLSMAASVDGLTWAIRDIMTKGREDVSVINMSFGTEGARSMVLETLVELAFTAGIVCVTAAGNGGVDARKNTPAGTPSVVTVGAVDEENVMLFNSSYGPGVDILAPGVDVDCSVPGGGRRVATGTSMAAGVVSGLVLYLKSCDERFKKAKDVPDMLKLLATKGVIEGLPEGTPNLLAFNGNLLEAGKV